MFRFWFNSSYKWLRQIPHWHSAQLLLNQPGHLKLWKKGDDGKSSFFRMSIFFSWGGDGWYFYRASDGVLQGRWFQLRASLRLKPNWRKMTKRKDSTLHDVVTAVFSQEHKHYRHWFNSHQLNWVFFWRGDKTQPGRDPYRSQHSAALLYKVFPLSQALVSILQRALEKVEISNPSPTSTPHLHRGKSGAMWFILFDKHPIFSEVF